MAHRLHPDLLTAKALADSWRVKPGAQGHRVWVRGETGWVIAKDLVASPEAAEAFILGALQIEEPPSRLPVLAKPAHVSFRLDDGDYGWI